MKGLKRREMKITFKNHVYLGAFCTIIGAVCGAVIWIFLKLMSVGIEFVWKWIPSQIEFPLYTLLVCTVGGAFIGVFRKRTGDYPDELDVVLGKMKEEGRYEYRNMFIMFLAALFPLIFGSSIGPEAGMTGIIVGLCCWAGENLKFAHQNAKAYSQIGMAVSLGVLFHSPLFGVFAVEEEGKELFDRESEQEKLTFSTKLVLYGLAIGGGTGIYMILSAIFESGLDGIPKFPVIELEVVDYLMMIPYILCGCILAIFYEATHKGAARVSKKLPPVLRETVGGFLLGLMGTIAPIIMFSGEEAMGELITDYQTYIPIVLITLAFLKVFLTNVCIQCGLKGGHFFPVIFAGVCLGYGFAMMALPEEGHEVFAAATVTAALLGGIMRKPLAVTMLMFLCFPVRMCVWIFLAAVLGSQCIKLLHKKETA